MTNSRPMFLWSLFTLQVICTFFFAGDALQDLLGEADQIRETNELLEVGVSLCLLLGTIFTGWELRHVFRREEKMRQQIEVASGRRLTSDDVRGVLQDENAFVAFCGPNALRQEIGKGISKRRFHYEEFEIRTGLPYSRALLSAAERWLWKLIAFNFKKILQSGNP